MSKALPKKVFSFFFLVLIVGIALTAKAQSYNKQEQTKTKPHNTEAACTPDSTIFTYTGAAVSFTVPPCVTSLTVCAWGGGGGGGGNDSYDGAPGGGGAFATSVLTVTSGQVLSVIVGGGGVQGANGAASTGAGPGGFGLGDGGSGGDPGSSGTSGAGGGGGGGSGIVSGGTILIDAAGGGGGGGGGDYSLGGAGGASGTTGTDGVSNGFTVSCFCTQTGGTGGAADGSPDTVGGQGANRGVGNDGGAGGGGGGGDNAGAGGGAPNCDCGGGGGGGGGSVGTTVINGSGQTVGNSGYSTLPAGTGAGGGAGAGGGSPGGNGYLVISYCVPVSFTLTTTQQNLSCYNSNDGYAVAHVTGGVGPFTYSWSTTPVQTSDSAYGLPAGTYTVTVGNGVTCDQTAIVTITEPAQLRDSIASFTNVSVACGANGSATVGVKGGDGNYTYSWNTTPVQTNATATNLGAGNYTVTVTDATCTQTATVTIAQPGALTASITGTTPALCNGTATGTATGSVNGGTGPYVYSWNSAPVQTNATATNLAAGSYTFSVTDANNCTVTAVAVVSQPSAIRDSIAKTINILCNGQTNGQATVGTKNGTGAFTYSWNTAPVQTTATATGLGVGSYTVTVADANGCKDSAVATITQPAALELTASPFAATCNNVCNGSATVIPSGGTQPYKYLWSNATSATSANVLNLCAGTYSVVVTDANGCTHDTTNLVVTQPAAISFTKTETAAFCNKADGGATVNITGGTPPYVYAWSNGQTTTQLSNVKPGSYCFGVQDANKCQDSVCVIIGNIPGETASITSTTPTTCNGGSNGKAFGTAIGGTMPYTYSWTTAPPQTTDSATGLKAATYTLTVTDSAGCTSTATATVTQPALVVTTVNANPVTICYGGTPSTLTATSTGGNGTYNYIWRPDTTVNNDTTGSTVQADPKTTLTYTVITTDGNNCTAANATVTVVVNPPLSVAVGAPVATCPGGSVTLTATAKGGNGNYTYNWLPSGGSGQSVTVTPGSSGYYTVVVNDGCTNPAAADSMKVIVDPLPVISFTADTTNGCWPVCVHFTDNSTIASGSIKSWKWSFGDGNTYSGNAATNKIDSANDCYGTPGFYSVAETVTSDSGCSTTVTQTNMITVYSHPQTNFIANPQSTTIEQPGISFTDQTTDVYGITNWLWETFGDASDSLAITPNAYHTYTDTGTFCVKLVTVNKHQCADSITKCVVVNALYTLYIPNAFTPNADGRDDVFGPVGTYFSQFEMYIFNRWGSPIYHTTDITKGWTGSVNNAGPLCQEDTYVYLINVTDFRGTEHSYLGRVTLVK